MVFIYYRLSTENTWNALNQGCCNANGLIRPNIVINIIIVNYSIFILRVCLLKNFFSEYVFVVLLLLMLVKSIKKVTSILWFIVSGLPIKNV